MVLAQVGMVRGEPLEKCSVDLQSVVECFQNIKPSTAHVEGAFSLMGAIIGQRRSLLSTNSASDVFFICGNRHSPWNEMALQEEVTVRELCLNCLNC